MSNADLTNIILLEARKRYASGHLEPGDAQLIVLVSIRDCFQEHQNFHGQSSDPMNQMERQEGHDDEPIKFKNKVRKAAPTLFT